MAQSLTRWLSELAGIGGDSQKVADACMSATNLTSVYGTGVAAVTDHGIDGYTKGWYRVRYKSGAFSTANAQISLVVSGTSTFATRQLHQLPNPVSVAATVTDPGVQSVMGYFDNGPTTFRYTRLENAGVVLGAAAITFDWEVLALP